MEVYFLAAKNAMSKADTDTKNAQMKIKHSQEEVKKRKSELKKTSSDYEKDKASMDNLAQQIKQIEVILVYFRWLNLLFGVV